MVGFKAARAFTVQLILSFVTAISTLVCEIYDTEPSYGDAIYV
jgi:hypothetical protein